MKKGDMEIEHLGFWIIALALLVILIIIIIILKGKGINLLDKLKEIVIYK